MATTLKGPGLFIAQFVGDKAPFDTLENIARWASSIGFRGLQLPTNDPNYFDVRLAAKSKTYCDEVKGVLAGFCLEITELSTHLQGQVLVTHPAFDTLFEAFVPKELHGNSTAKKAWAREQIECAAKASFNLGLTAHATFSGSLLWPYFYPWPQRPTGLVEEGFAELGRQWRPILDRFDEAGVTVCYELHPGEDLHDGATFERFLKAVDDHPRAGILYDPSHFVLQHLDYLAFLDIYRARIGAFHVKDAEFRPNGRSGVYGGYQNWVDRPGRFRSVGDGQVDFGAIFSKFAQFDFPGWAVLEWECCLKNAEDGAREGAKFISDHIIRVADYAFDDFAKTDADPEFNRTLLGL